MEVNSIGFLIGDDVDGMTHCVSRAPKGWVGVVDCPFFGKNESK